VLPIDILLHLELSEVSLLPEDKNLMILAGDGYVAGTALALIFLPEPPLAPKSAEHRYRRHDIALAECALKIRRVATYSAIALAVFWLLGNQDAFGVSGYRLLPSDHSLFAAIPLFGLADMMAGIYAYLLTKPENQSPIRQREVGDTTGQLFSITLASVYLGFWLGAYLLGHG
jgi:hypothetical protein